MSPLLLLATLLVPTAHANCLKGDANGYFTVHMQVDGDWVRAEYVCKDLHANGLPDQCRYVRAEDTVKLVPGSEVTCNPDKGHADFAPWCAGAPFPVTIALDHHPSRGGLVDFSGHPNPVAYFGGPGSDEVVGSPHGDYLFGGNHVDVFDGGPGPDLLCGGPGDDILSGADDKDVLIGGGQEDTLDGGPEDDVLGGGGKDDTLEGGHGHDVLCGGTFSDAGPGEFLSGGPGDDRIQGAPGRDTLLGGQGADLLLAVDLEDDVQVAGGSERDVCFVDAVDSAVDCEQVTVRPECPQLDHLFSTVAPTGALELWVQHPYTGAEVSHGVITDRDTGEPYLVSHGLAIDPVRCRLWAQLERADGVFLAVVDPVSFEAEERVDTTADDYVDLAFDPAGGMYALTRSGALDVFDVKSLARRSVNSGRGAYDRLAESTYLAYDDPDTGFFLAMSTDGDAWFTDMVYPHAPSGQRQGWFTLNDTRTWPTSDYLGGPYTIQDVGKDAGQIVQISPGGAILDCDRKHFECEPRGGLHGSRLKLASGAPLNLTAPHW